MVLPAGLSSVFLNDSADEPVDFRNELGASRPDALKVQTGEPWKVVRPVELPQQVIAFVHEPPQDLCLFVRRAQLIFTSENRAHHVVQQSSPENVADAEAVLGTCRDHGNHLVGDFEPLMLGGGDLLGGEEVGGADASEGTPVISVWSEPNSPVEHEPVSRLFHRTGGEDGTVEDLLGDVMVACDDETCLTQAESHQPLCLEELSCFGELVVC